MSVFSGRMGIITELTTERMEMEAPVGLLLWRENKAQKGW